MLKNIQIILIPFAILYAGVINVRHLLFEKGILKSHKFDTPIIGVGNLSFGGAGKSPFVIYLTQIAQLKGKTVGIVSRGYGRKSKGMIFCSSDHSSEDIGDEPKMYLSKLKGVQVVVSEKRKLAIEALESSTKKPDIIILDDCYQHRHVIPKVLFLLTTETAPYWKDYLVPAGYLRDVKSAAKRADALVITKSTKTNEITIPNYWKNKPTFISSVNYDKFLNSSGQTVELKDIIGFSGLADNTPLQTYLKRNFILHDFYSYDDHHWFTDNELMEILDLSKYNQTTSIVTTEKDYARLSEKQKELFGTNLYVLKISTPVSEESELIQFLADSKVL